MPPIAPTPYSAPDPQGQPPVGPDQAAAVLVREIVAQRKLLERIVELLEEIEAKI